MYGVDLDPTTGNYLLLGGSGDEYEYSATKPNGWTSDEWVSYLVVVNPKVNITLDSPEKICANFISREKPCSKESLATKVPTMLVNILALIRKLVRS